MFHHLLNEFFLSCFFISSGITGNSRIVLRNNTDNSFSFIKAVMTESSNGSENLGFNLDEPSACTSFFNDRNSNKVAFQQTNSPAL